MAFIPVPNAALVELRMLLDNQRIENTLWFDVGATPTAGDLAALASALKTWWTTSYAPFVVAGVTLTEVRATDQTSNTGAVASFTTGGPWSGGASGGAAPNNVAPCVTFRTAARGRTARGRNYVSGIQAGNIVGNTLNATIGSMIVAAYANLMTTSNTAGFTWCVASRFLNNAPRGAGILRPVTAVTMIDLTVDSQRRRLPKRGQ